MNLIKFQALITTLTLVLGLSAQAAWPPRAIELMRSAGPKDQTLSNPAVSTFWGGFKRYQHFSHNDGEILDFPSPLFKGGKYPLYLSQKSVKAPLFVFMPGIYGQPNSGLTPQFVDQLEALGGHVLVVPNLLAPNYVKAFPLYAEDPVSLEVQVLEEALSFALKELGERAQRVDVIAESLGTALGAAWSAHDRLHQKRLHSLSLLWPPLDLPLAMKNFDNIIDEHRPAHARCWTLEKLSILMRQFIFQTYPGAMTLSEQECVGALVLVDGFVKATQRSWRAYNEVAPTPGAAPEGFEEYFRRYRPEFWKLISENDERLKLGHWMRILRRDPNFVVRIMTSRDDFLNRGLDWGVFQSEHKLSARELVVLDWGGHSGPVSAPEFFQALGLALSAAD